MISARTRAGGETRGGSVFRWAPSEKPFSYSKQHKDPPAAAAPPRIRFPGNHLLSLEAIARHNGQVIHPLRLLARETTTAPGPALVFSPSPSAFCASRGIARDRETERKRNTVKERRRKREREEGEEGGRENERLETHARTRVYTFAPGYFRPRSLLYASLEIAIDHSRVNHPDRLDRHRQAAAATAARDADSKTIVPAY